MMTTVLRRHPEQYLQNLGRTVLLGVYSTSVLSDHLLSSPNLLLDFAISTLGFRKAFGEHSKLGGGAFYGDDHDTVLRDAPNNLHTLGPSLHTPRTTSKANPPGFKGVGEPLPCTAGISCF